MSQNLSETQFHYVIKLYATQQLLKLADLLRESGEILVNSWLHVSNLMLNLQEGNNESESVRDTVSLRYKDCFKSGAAVVHICTESRPLVLTAGLNSLWVETDDI